MTLLFLLLGCDPDPCEAEPGSVCAWAGTGDAAFDGGGEHRLDSMFYFPMDVEPGPDGRQVIADWNNHKLRLVEEDGTLTTIMGTTFVGDGPADLSDSTPAGAPGTSVNLNHPTDQVWLPDGRLLSASWHTHKLRTWDPATGLVHVVLGSAPGFAGDEAALAEVKLNQPKAVTVTASGGVYIVDMRNERVRLWEGDVVRTVAGNGEKSWCGDGGPAVEACLAFPKSENPEPGGALALSADESLLYIADTENHRIRAVDLASGVISTVAGTGTPGFSGDGGPALSAQLNHPRDLERLPDGRLVIADTDNHRIRVFDPSTGELDTLAGTGVAGSEGDLGPALDASFYRPFGVGVDEAGVIYVSDTFNHRIRTVYP